MSTVPRIYSHPAGEELYLGLDVGSVNVRIAVVDKSGRVLHTDMERIYKGPGQAAVALLERAQEAVSFERIAGAGVTGSGRQLYRDREGWQEFSSPYAAIRGVLWDQPDPKTIIEIGAQSALVIGLEKGLEKPWRVSRSPLCAAGTGRFLEQQSSRLGISIEEFGPLALKWTQAPPRIAARCSVFAKSDLIHLQQKGWPITAMLAGLSDAVARMILAQWRDQFEQPLICIGGVAANEGVVRGLKEALGGMEVIVPPEAASREAIGAALLARLAPARPTEFFPDAERDSEMFFVPRALPREFSSSGWVPKELGPEIVDAYLGVDVGSTSTKAAVIDASGEVLAKTYLMTAGQPLEAVKQVMANLVPMVEDKVRVRAVGVTGSGRYLVGAFIGADLVKNEITAQTRAALHFDPRIDTVFEMGGQDSKYVYLENGTVLDYQMNKACAAGTGSFVDELAEQLGISTRTGEFSSLAFSADTQLDLGEKCAAFMSQAVTSAQHAGVEMDVIVSSLATSLAKNYRSKVVGMRRVGQRIFLTGAVFYNQAVVSAYKAEFPERTLVVPEHKEVTGAIGAALLAKEAMAEGQSSRFKGFASLARESYKLKSFTCHHCEHCCAISAMTTDSGARLFYGSRCDRYDSAEASPGPKNISTPFTQREALLFEGYDAAKGTGPVVGVPRAMMAFDLAPLLTGFLNALGVRVLYSPPTRKQLVEKSMRHAYTDSCFPIKLLHGHVAELLKQGAEYILIPNAIRMAEKQGDEDQRYACPLVQSAPYIIRSVFDLGERVLDPIVDLSRGERTLVRSFVDIARQLGYSQEQGLKAAQDALAAQRQFEERLQSEGQRTLAALANDPRSIGVVFLSRAYNAQDSGANLGMAQEMAKLGVVPIPMDFLPLHQVDIKEITDRPYWNYERKILAASKLIAENPQLFGLFLSNFGCGPNSFIQNIVEDIMGSKPLGQIEVDEHAAEAGYITRLEALVDTIRGYRKAGLHLSGSPEKYVRRVATVVRSGQNVLMARMADHAEVCAAAMRSFGVNAQVLPESDDRSIALSRDLTSGKECLPFRDTLGVFLRMSEDGDIPAGARALMPGAFGPCRLGKYAQEQQKILDERGIALEVMTTVSNDAYSDLGLGSRFELLAWRGVVATDYLQRLLWATRPYERYAGETSRAYQTYLGRLVQAIETRQPLDRLLREATATFIELRDPSLPRRPLVGINGEIYLRANRFCNKDLVLLCEANGLEVEVAPMGEWIKYVTVRNVEDAWADRNLRRLLRSNIRKLAVGYYEKMIASYFGQVIHEREPNTQELMTASAPYLPSRNGSEAVLSLGSGLRQMEDPHFAGVISVMPHGCMPGGIVAAYAEQISRKYGNKPWISLTYDGFPDKVNPERIADLAEQLRHKSSRGPMDRPSRNGERTACAIGSRGTELVPSCGGCAHAGE
ncbi:MAG: hypothetical protein EPO21_05445 [Chloroflexota bacterium]|nr:MAG: hypothetical protein EPO21_05445 [Chloroflexota bacterium]